MVRGRKHAANGAYVQQDDTSLLHLVGQELFDAIPRHTPLEAYLEWACRQHGAPAMYHVASITAVAVHELARRGFRLGTGAPLGMWFALIGDSASGKSTAIDMADDFIHAVWHESACTPTVDPWVEASGSVAGLLSAINEHYDQNRGTTVCMLYEHEFSSVFNTRETITEFLCNLADGRTIQRNLRELQKAPRAGATTAGRLDRVYLPCTSGLFATTEPALSAVFTEAMRHGGLFSRVWWIRPKFQLSNFRLRTVDHDAEREAAVAMWAGWIASLGLHGSYTIQFEPEAWEYLEQFIFRPLAGACTEGDNLNASRIRAVEKAQVIAGLFAMMAGRIVIGVDDVKLAHRFMGILLAHTKLMHGLGSSELMRLVMLTESLIIQAGNVGLSKRDIYKKLHKEKRIVDLVIETLLDRGSIVEDKSTRYTQYIYLDTERGKQIQSAMDAWVTSELRGAVGASNVIDLTRKR